MSLFIVTLGFTLAISSKWAYSYFGLSSFEQIVYHIKVPLEGTNTQFIFGWMKKCLLPGFIFGLIFSWIPINIAKLILLLCCIYGLCQIHFFSYIFNQFKKTDFFDKYYVESEVISPEKKMNFIHIYLESMETTYATKEDGGNADEDLLPYLTQLTKDSVSFSQNEKIGGARVLTGTGWTTGGIVASTSGLPLIFSLKHKFCKDKVPFMPGVNTLGDIVEKDQIIAMVDETPVYASLTGVLRGIIRDGYKVPKGMKIADIDPRKEQKKNCNTISDKARCIAGSVVEVLMANGVLP